MPGKQLCYCTTCNGRRRLCASELRRHRRIDFLQRELEEELSKAEDSPDGSDDDCVSSVAPESGHDAFSEDQVSQSADVPLDVFDHVDACPDITRQAGTHSPCSGIEEDIFLAASTALTGKPAWPSNTKTSEKVYCKTMGKLFSDIGLSQVNVSKALAAFKSTVSEPNNLPGSFRQMLRAVRPDLLKVSKAYICPKGCGGYQMQQGDCQSCKENAELVPFYFFDVCEWLQKMYSDRNIALLLKSHRLTVLADDEALWDVWQTRLWNELFSPSGPFGGDKRCVAMSLAVDGTSPFKRGNYNFWPFVISILNLPPNIRFSPFLSLLWGIVPAAEKPAGFNGAFDVLVDQLDRLNRGMLCMDASLTGDSQAFQLKGRLVLLKVCELLNIVSFFVCFV